MLETHSAKLCHICFCFHFVETTPRDHSESQDECEEHGVKQGEVCKGEGGQMKKRMA